MLVFLRARRVRFLLWRSVCMVCEDDVDKRLATWSLRRRAPVNGARDVLELATTAAAADLWMEPKRVPKVDDQTSATAVLVCGQCDRCVLSPLSLCCVFLSSASARVLPALCFSC